MRLNVVIVLVVGLFSATSWSQTPVHNPPPALKCPGDVIVWVNTRSGVYHFPGARYFGSTKQGKFTCEKYALAEGDRPTKNGQ